MHFRTKPIIGASYQTLKNKLDGIALDTEATDFDEVEYEEIKVSASRQPQHPQSFPHPLPPTPTTEAAVSVLSCWSMH